MISANRARACSSAPRSLYNRLAISAARGPERRTIPMPPRPGGVEMATIVSFAFADDSRSDTDCESGSTTTCVNAFSLAHAPSDRRPRIAATPRHSKRFRGLRNYGTPDAACVARVNSWEQSCMADRYGELFPQQSPRLTSTPAPEAL